MYCTNFEYAGERLSDYEMMLCRFDGSGGLETVSSGADLTFHQIKPSGSHTFHLYASSYEEAYTATFQICRAPSSGSSQEDMYLTPELVSALQRWLCRKQYHRFKIDQEHYEQIYWNAVFSSKQIHLNGRIAGLELTLHTDAPFAYMDELSAEYECSANTPIYLYDKSDEVGSIRPDLEITCNEEGDFLLEYSTDKEPLKVADCRKGEVLTICGKTQTIHSSEASHNLARDFNYSFPVITNTYENNQNIFTPNLNCKLKVSYSPVKKIGI